MHQLIDSFPKRDTGPAVVPIFGQDILSISITHGSKAAGAEGGS
jgi:hypothetical protein